MTPKTTKHEISILLKLAGTAALALFFCAFTLPARAGQQQQNQPNQDQTQDQAAPPAQEAQPPMQPDAQGQPAAPDQQPDQQQPGAQSQGQPQGQMNQGPAETQPATPDQQPPTMQPQTNQPVPATLTLPAGTVIRVRVDDWVSSDRNVIGDNFTGELDQPIVANGWVVARRGQAQTGRVSQVKKGHAGSTSQLGLELPGLTLVDGQQMQLQTQLYQASGGSGRDNTGRDVATVGGTTGIGAIIGGIAGGGTGAAIGAGIGATAGIIGVMSTQGRPTVIRPETVLSFRLTAPVTISTEKSQFAFQPVTQSDYNSPQQQQIRPRMNRRPPPPPYYPYPYAYGPYPYPYYGR